MNLEKKFCIVCGSENFSRSKLYCSRKCKNHDYFQKNKAEINEYRKKWAKENRDTVNKHVRKYVENNREKYNEYHRDWYKKRKKEKEENGK